MNASPRPTCSHTPSPTPYTVSKIGSRTGYTEGWVVDCEASFVKGGQTYTNVIYIVSLEKNCRGDFAFADQGDSGAAILNKDRKIVGIVQGGPADLSATYGCHIHPVISLLDVTPITAATPHSYATTLGDAEANWLGDRLSALKQSFLGSTQGRLLYGLVEQHRWEVSELVNKCRPVTLAWHRNQGPAFLNRVMANSRNPEVLIPEQIEGVDLPQLCQAMFPPADAIRQRRTSGIPPHMGADRPSIYPRPQEPPYPGFTTQFSPLP